MKKMYKLPKFYRKHLKVFTQIPGVAEVIGFLETGFFASRPSHWESNEAIARV